MTDPTPDVEQLAASLVSAKEQMDAAKAALDEAKRGYAQLESQMIEAMEGSASGLVKSGERFVSVRTAHRWSVPKEHADAVVALLKAHRPAVVKETVHGATLNKLAEEMRVAEAPAPWWGDVGGLLSMATTTTVHVTKSKPKGTSAA